MTRRPRATLLFALLALAAARPAPAPAMEMKLDGQRLVLAGLVQADDPQRLFSALAAAGPRVAAIHLRDSPGGVLRAGLLMGQLIRDRGLFTITSGLCASSCALAFLGGRERFFADDRPAIRNALGFHGSYRADTLALVPELVPLLERYVQEQTGGRTTPRLLERWSKLGDPRELVYFFHPDVAPALHGVSVVLCGADQRGEGGQPRFERCEPIANTDALRQGIVTSTRIYRVVSELPGAPSAAR